MRISSVQESGLSPLTGQQLSSGNQRMNQKMPRYRIEKQAVPPTAQDIKGLCAALEDCFSSAAQDISIHDKESYFQYQDLMEEFNIRYDKLAEAYIDSFEVISMLAGKTDLGKRFEKLDAPSGTGRDRSWYEQAYRAVRDKALTKRLSRKKRFGF